MVPKTEKRSRKERHKMQKKRRKNTKRTGGDKKNTFKGVNSQRVAIPGVVSIPSWHSSDKKCLNSADREGERNRRREAVQTCRGMRRA